MLSRKCCAGIVLAGLSVAATPVFSQSSQASSSFSTTASKSEVTSEATGDTTVVVEGRRSPIDRKSYDVCKLPDSQTGSAADLLAKIPGVVVDATGEVTYHGKAVTIYLNGHPSLILQGDNRAIALQSMPASYVASIQVTSNPGAQINSSSEGNPVINIVTRRNLPAGVFGALSASLAYPVGYSRAGPYLTYHVGKLALMASVNLTNRAQESNLKYRTSQLNSSGQISTTNSAETAIRSRARGVTAFSNVEYALTDNDILTADGTYYDTRSSPNSVAKNLTWAGNGLATEAFDAVRSANDQSASNNLVIGWTHYGNKPDETLKVSENFSNALTSSQSQTSTAYTVSALASNLAQHRITQSVSKFATHQSLLNIDYNTPVGADQLAIGLEFSQRSDRSVTQFVTFNANQAAGVVNSLLTSQFMDRQTQSAAYVTYQRELGEHLTVLGGLRFESSDITANQPDTQTLVHAGYNQLNPSLFATYVLSSAAKLRFSYTHRLQLPRPYDLNPSVIYGDANHISSGSPTLKPQQTDAFELKYDYDGQKLWFGLHGFYQENRQLLLTSSDFVTDPLNAGNLVLRTTTGNFGNSRTGGLAFTWSDQLSAKLSLSLNTTLSKTDLHAVGIDDLSIISVSGNISANYSITRQDFISASLTRAGPNIIGEGYTTPFIQSSIVYSHLVKSGLLVTIGLNDFLRTTKTGSTTQAHAYRSQFEISNRSPTVSISLRRPFGGSKKTSLH